MGAARSDEILCQGRLGAQGCVAAAHFPGEFLQGGVAGTRENPWPAHEQGGAFAVGAGFQHIEGEAQELPGPVAVVGIDIYTRRQIAIHRKDATEVCPQTGTGTLPLPTISGEMRFITGQAGRGEFRCESVHVSVGQYPASLTTRPANFGVRDNQFPARLDIRVTGKSLIYHQWRRW